ncbi:hypothetical protein G3570_02610 [Balneolaceae bacterium YR4-1]|uniref:Uncharacterized protein n=1 Tax=Halalkalibaculum roseum TaxID=2709311 RepID=A0A6M1STS9_9BACT|nr:GDCCVxC domain-containing (seleno)protein [Halalkalibaculum roseum]NGP75508.1 hypothetical protein [Halalkalibaculum roseum]
MKEEIALNSTVTCPECGHQSKETMPEDSCLFFWKCPNCEELIKPQKGDCCVYCSYGDTPCPPVQKSGCC